MAKVAAVLAVVMLCAGCAMESTKAAAPAAQPLVEPPRPREGSLEIVTVVRGADLYVNDRFYGTTPGATGSLHFSLPLGDYQVRICAPGYKDYTRAITITPGNTHPLAVSMEPLPGKRAAEERQEAGLPARPDRFGQIILMQVPDGASIYVNGQLYSQAPQERGGAYPLRLPVGPQRITVTRPAGEPYMLDVTVLGDQEQYFIVGDNAAPAPALEPAQTK